MKKSKWQIILSALLVILSAMLYFAHFLIFRDSRHIFIYLLGDLAFLPVEVLFVTLIINQLLSSRDKRVKLKKLNMVIGTFFSEVGSPLLRRFLKFAKNEPELATIVMHTRQWADKDFARLLRQLPDFTYVIDIHGGDLPGLKTNLCAQRGFLLSLLGNANLLEHDKFTDLLWAVFHLTDELEQRREFGLLPAADLEHLAQDLRRAFMLLTLEWLAYMRHLRHDYPYLFSLAIRTNPFDGEASPIIKQ
ncbi:MAG: hypothetical protein NTW95_00960 [Candidatus Aminicenantes bacterium]|nr:hypothetical protein [Candidatus Aminicenantes bacterium]